MEGWSVGKNRKPGASLLHYSSKTLPFDFHISVRNTSNTLFDFNAFFQYRKVIYSNPKNRLMYFSKYAIVINLLEKKGRVKNDRTEKIASKDRKWIGSLVG